MENRCETVGKYLLPLFRAMVAKELVVTHKLTQTQASKVLGTTQAAVSQYINSKRAINCIERFAKMLPQIQAMSHQTASRLAKKEVTWTEVSSNFCKVCSTMFEENSDLSGDYYNI